MSHIEQNFNIFSQAIGLALFEKMPVSEFFNRINNTKLEQRMMARDGYSKFLWTLMLKYDKYHSIFQHNPQVSI